MSLCLGATGVDKTPFLNLMAVAPGIVEFVKTTDCRGHVKDGSYLAAFVVDHVLGLPEEERLDVVQVRNVIVFVCMSVCLSV